MNIKLMISVFYFSLGIIYGLAIVHLNKFSSDLGMGLLLIASVFCPIGMSIFGWLKNLSRANRIFVAIFSITGAAFWFFMSSFITVWLAIGGDGK